VERLSELRAAEATREGLGKASGITRPAVYREAIVEVTDEGIACTKAICNYVYDTYGRFPATVDAMHLMWFMQAHHLDLEFYAKYFKPGACGPTHLAHMERWHGEREHAEREHGEHEDGERDRGKGDGPWS
jgi:hypothetical protein